MQTPIEQFAEQHRLRVSRDECNDQIIEGKNGQFYFDGDSLNLMATDARVIARSRWEGIGGKLWLGDISLNAKGKRVQDVKISGVQHVKAAMRVATIRPIQVLSPARLAVLGKAQEAARIAREKRLADDNPTP